MLCRDHHGAPLLRGRDSCLPGLLWVDMRLARPPPWAPSLDPVVPLPAWGPSKQSPTVRPGLFTHTLASSLLEPFLQPARDTAYFQLGTSPGCSGRAQLSLRPSRAERSSPPGPPARCPRADSGALQRLCAFFPREQLQEGADLALTSTRSPGTDRGAEAASEDSRLDCRPLRAHLPPSQPRI